MKKILAVLITIACILALVGCGGEAGTSSEQQTSAAPETESMADASSEAEGGEPSSEESKPESGSKILIAYFSRAGENYNVGVVEKGNTQVMAEMIADLTGGTLFKIETVNPYPETYEECTEVAQQEQDDNARPELNAAVENFGDYDTVILGYPIWWGDMPMAMYTFLESYDFSGKTILPFNTHEGSGVSGTTVKIQNAAPDATVLEGLAVYGKTAQEASDDTRATIQGWLSASGLE